jgi:two-component system cell cycle sensor histidine kinase/response regulator CckA
MQMLKTMQYKVIIARSGTEAIKIYAEQKDKIDLVILDMIMPNLGGSETYDRLKRINSSVKVLLSSGYSIEGQAADIMNRGCNGFIQKPFSIIDLSHKLRKVFDS